MSDDEQNSDLETYEFPQFMQLWHQQRQQQQQSAVRRHFRRLRRVIRRMTPRRTRQNQIDWPDVVQGQYQRFDDISGEPQQTPQFGLAGTFFGRNTGYEQEYENNEGLVRRGETGSSDQHWGSPVPLTSQPISKPDENQYKDIDYRHSTDEEFARYPYNYGEEAEEERADSHTPKKYDTSSGHLFEGPDGPQDTITNDKCRMLFMPFPSRTSSYTESSPVVRSRSMDDMSALENQQQFYPLRRSQSMNALSYQTEAQRGSDSAWYESQQSPVNMQITERRPRSGQSVRTRMPFIKHYRKFKRIIRKTTNPQSVYRPNQTRDFYQKFLQRPYDGPVITEITDNDESDGSEAERTQNIVNPNRMTVSADIHEPPNTDSSDRFRLKFVPIPDTRPTSAAIVGETHRSPAVIGSTLRPGLSPHAYIQGMDNTANQQYLYEAGTSAEDLGDPFPATNQTYIDTDYSKEIDESFARDPYNYGESDSDSYYG